MVGRNVEQTYGSRPVTNRSAKTDEEPYVACCAFGTIILGPCEYYTMPVRITMASAAFCGAVYLYTKVCGSEYGRRVRVLKVIGTSNSLSIVSRGMHNIPRAADHFPLYHFHNTLLPYLIQYNASKLSDDCKLCMRPPILQSIAANAAMRRDSETTPEGDVSKPCWIEVFLSPW